MRVVAAVVVALVLAAPVVAAPVPLPEAPNCPVFPASNVWNKPVNKLPIRSSSQKIVRSIGANLLCMPTLVPGPGTS